jgi:hypothetical protein
MENKTPPFYKDITTETKIAASNSKLIYSRLNKMGPRKRTHVKQNVRE